MLGVLMLQTRFPRPPGDSGHAATFGYPVSRRVGHRATGLPVHHIVSFLKERVAA